MAVARERRLCLMPGQTVSTEPAGIQLRLQVVMVPPRKESRWGPLVSGGVPCSPARSVHVVDAFKFPPDCSEFPLPHF